MAQNLKNTFITILEITGYHGDRYGYAEEFITTCWQTALIDRVNALPEDIQKDVTEQLGARPTSEKINKVLTQLIPEEELKESFLQVYHAAFKAYLEKVLPTLTREQRNTLSEYLASFSKGS